MTRDEFIARFIDEFAGMLLDAQVERRGSDLSMWTRQAYSKLKARLGAAYDALKPPVQPDPKPNGSPAQQPQGAKK